ncbi:MAG: 2-oxopent-4-enoate hydratase [Desulfobacterales bacterium]|nr:2-oxopent-4-enoate hydratase [Desulfobacterales bacterium]
MNPFSISAIADKLENAYTQCTPISQLTQDYPNITVEDAYAVQIEQIDRRIKAGKATIGKKIGLTSLAMQKMLGVDEPDFGHLLDDMLIYDGECIERARLIAPKVEPEIAFIMSGDLQGPGVTPADVLQNTMGVTAALEIIDSRIKDWKIKIQDTVADNASSAVFTLGGRIVAPLDIDLRYTGMVFRKNGRVCSTGAGAAVLGNPTQAVAWLANKLADFGSYICRGDVILAGALVKAEEAVVGDNFSVIFDRIGDACCNFS